MKVGIIGGGIAGLSAAYYLKKFGIPVSKIILLESSNRFGGWIESKKFIDETNNRQIIFEYGPRTLRYSGANKELNTLSMALDLELEDDIDLIRNTHPASTKRYIYLNGKVNLIRLKRSLFFQNPVLGQPLLRTIFKEYRTPARSSDIKDESIYDFITRRVNSTIAENVVDPVIKGICGGDIKNLSAASLLSNIYDAELKSGSIVRNMFMGNIIDPNKKIIIDPYENLNTMKEKFAGTSVWRLKSGMQTLADTLIKHLKKFDDVELKNNEECLKIDFNSKLNRVEVKTSKNIYDFDYVISSVYSKQLANFLTDDHLVLKNMLNKIPAVNMVVVNLYFDKNILPVEGFGYLVPSKENSPILGCIFDSIFDKENKDHSTLTVMMGGALYEKFIGDENDHEKLLNLALNTLKTQLKFNLQPKKYQVSIMKNCIPQYRVGHQSLLNDIFSYLNNNNLDEKLYLIGSSYKGFSINDIIFNARNLCQIILKNRLLSTNSSS